MRSVCHSKLSLDFGSCVHMMTTEASLNCASGQELFTQPGTRECSFRRP